MEKFREALEMILVMILSIIDETFVILEAPYIVIMCVFLSYGKCDKVYIWVPIKGLMSLWICDWKGKVDYDVDGHVLIRKLFKK
jgi:hypothetical protein|uniref:Uncharacterized protein n=1 Tax=Siphoviridae sp. cthu813 TaxID=2825618 RepID=A0A8S5VHV9_9CAUD|nr:MAG TPA: hypothetical protein [Siphoviridae sp. cthu813]